MAAGVESTANTVLAVGGSTTKLVGRLSLGLRLVGIIPIYDVHWVLLTVCTSGYFQSHAVFAASILDLRALAA